MIAGSHEREVSKRIAALPLADDGLDGLMDDDAQPDASKGLTVDQMPCTVLDSQPGDAIVFDYRIWHGSWRSEAVQAMAIDREMISLMYYKRPVTSLEKERMDRFVSEALEARRQPRSIWRAYPPKWL